MTIYRYAAELQFDHPTMEDETHILRVECIVEKTRDWEAYGSTYVPRDTASIESETWFLDGRRVASWALEHHMRVMGLLKRDIDKLADSIRNILQEE